MITIKPSQTADTRSDLLARLERMEGACRDQSTGHRTCVSTWLTHREDLSSHFARYCARYALDALALAEARAALGRLGTLERMLPRCPECGPTRIDEDGCCTGCGADAAPPTGGALR